MLTEKDISNLKQKYLDKKYTAVQAKATLDELMRNLDIQKDELKAVCKECFGIEELDFDKIEDLVEAKESEIEKQYEVALSNYKEWEYGI